MARWVRQGKDVRYTPDGSGIGYGATTLPALTEAITYEKNATLAQHESSRLQGLIDKLVKQIEV